MFEAFRLHGLGYGQLAKRVFWELDRDNALGMAAELAYFTLLSIFPFLLFLLSLIAYLPIPGLEFRVLAYMSRVVPPDAMHLVRDIVVPLVARQHGSILTISILFTIWSASMAMSTLASVLNHAYDLPETRSYPRRKSMAIVLTLGLSGFIILAAVLLFSGPLLAQAVAAMVGLGALFKAIWLVVQWPVIFILISFAMALIYHFAPSTKPPWHWITPGSVVATILWIAFSLGFAYYVRNFGSYNKVYGSIGAVIILMFWLYLSGLAVIIGAELNSEIARARREATGPTTEHP
jgi:membrane protein